jgi:hypothetical protein
LYVVLPILIKSELKEPPVKACGRTGIYNCTAFWIGQPVRALHSS